MDDKNTLLAIALSIVILIGWNYLAEYMGWVQRPEITQENKKESQPTPTVVPAESTQSFPVFTPAAGREIKIDTPLYSAVLYTGGGILHSFMLKNYKADLEHNSSMVDLISSDTAKTSPMGLTINGQASWSVGEWSFDGNNITLASGESKSLTCTGIIDNIRVTRIFTFKADTYLIAESLRVGSADKKQRSVRVGAIVAATPFGENRYDPSRIAWDKDGSFKEEDSQDDLTKSGIMEIGLFNWAGIMSNYFLNIVAPGDPRNLTLKGRIQGNVWRVALEQPDFIVPESGEVPMTFNWWFGPKDRALLQNMPGNMENALHFGMFSFIARPLLAVLHFFQGFVGNWGVAIILLTICIRILFWPLTQKSYKSMEQMKKIQPILKKLQEQYKDDRQKLNQEVMQIYRTYKVNPAGGCLPILIQIPVFIGLYQALLNSIELRHAGFIDYLPFTNTVWLADLSAADPFYITPILMGLTMFLQQKLTPPAGDPTQQKIMMFMPLLFLFMFLNFPAGLVLYWLCNNVLSVAQQWFMLRKKS